MQQEFFRHVNVLLRVKSFADLICFILIFLKRKGASSLVITSFCGFSAHLLRSEIAILVLCTFCVEVQGKSADLSMKWFSPLFSVIEHDIYLIVSINDINSLMHNLRDRKSATQARTPSYNCTKEYHFRSSDALLDVIEVSNLFANCKRSNASLHFKFVFILKLFHIYIIKNMKLKTTITLSYPIFYIKLYIRGF